jgi:hypothetical protein
VVDIKKNGAVVVMHKNGDKKAFIPGWAHKVAKMEGTYLTTTLAVTLAMGDLIAFYIDPKQRAAPYYGVGCNVLVLKHANSGDAVRLFFMAGQCRGRTAHEATPHFLI